MSNFMPFSTALGDPQAGSAKKTYERPQVIDDASFIEHPIFVKLGWKRERTLRIDFAEKTLTIFDGTTPKFSISGSDLQKVEADREDPSAVNITYHTHKEKKPSDTERIFAESKEQRPVVLRDLSDYLRIL
ncbi:MAG: hypothetical protein EZS28_018837 [Streblomastix strix]|uniref:Uncharacterized protein n=1 Tax=Streblomastix strix TaxID=222440 RepID=A0A5J4VSP0_9EUKA|nr:MAG: hypothetical protein EZS28_018837 [Streblomastix strix]